MCDFDWSGICLYQFIFQFMAVVLLPVVWLGPKSNGPLAWLNVSREVTESRGRVT